MMTELWELSASQLATVIRERQASAAEAVEIYLARIADRNAELNAIVTLDEDGARADAKRLDALRSRGEVCGPLHGIPITIKDSLAVAGMRTTSGFPPLADYVPTRDATVVARVRSAGAIVLGKTNLPTLAGDGQTDNPIFGRTNNPWDLTRTPGGSTGGGAAALSAGMTALELGSDIAGSLRMPAHFCGVCALKPTEHAVPLTGHIPPLPGAPRTARHMSVIGPLARAPVDLSLVLRVIAGPDGQDLEVVPANMTAQRTEFDVVKCRIAWVDQFGDLAVSHDTRRALAKTVERAVDAGWQIEQVALDGIDWTAAWESWGELFQTEVAAGMSLDDERALLASWNARTDSDEPVLRGMARAFNATMRQYVSTLVRRDALTAALDQLLTSWDALLCPVGVGPAFPHCPPGAPISVDDHSTPYMAATIGYTAPFNVSGHPAVVVPAARSSNGLPIGVQLVGRRWDDHALVRIAERLFDGSSGGAVNDQSSVRSA